MRFAMTAMAGGQPGWETSSAQRKDGAVNAFVAMRVLVALEGDGAESVGVLHDAAAKLDMPRLAALR